MTDDKPDEKLWKTARHEAGHAVAALHYGCPIAFTSIEAAGIALGTTRMRLQEAGDAVTIFCGPMAEHDWSAYVPGTQGPEIITVGPDQEALEILASEGCNLNTCCQEALFFVSQPAVQQQIDRVAQELLARAQLTEDEVRAAAGFSECLCSRAWQRAQGR